MDVEHNVQLNLEGDASGAQGAIQQTTTSATTLESRLLSVANSLEKVASKLDAVTSKLGGQRARVKEVAEATENLSDTSEMAARGMQQETLAMQGATAAANQHVSVITRVNTFARRMALDFASAGSGAQRVSTALQYLRRFVVDLAKGWVIYQASAKLTGAGMAGVGSWAASMATKLLGASDATQIAARALGFFRGEMDRVGAVGIADSLLTGFRSVGKAATDAANQAQGFTGKVKAFLGALNFGPVAAEMNKINFKPLRQGASDLAVVVRVPIAQKLLEIAGRFISTGRAAKDGSGGVRGFRSALDDMYSTMSMNDRLWEAMDGGMYRMRHQFRDTAPTVIPLQVAFASLGEKVVGLANRFPFLDKALIGLGTKVAFAAQPFKALIDRFLVAGDATQQYIDNVAQISAYMTQYGVSASKAKKMIEEQNRRFDEGTEKVGRFSGVCAG